MPPSLFPSFFLGGFEASTMRRVDGRRNDLIAATRHDVFAVQDYARLLDVGIRAARDGTAWHLIEPRRGRFDFRSVLPRVRAARELGLTVIWDLCHFGWPDAIDPFAADFPERLAAFARAFARLVRDETDAVPWYAPINEISFASWAAGEVGYLNPFERGRGQELKLQFVRAALAAGHALRDVDPRARICHIDPIVHVEPLSPRRDSVTAAARHNASQFDAWDSIAGRANAECGGSEDQLDVIGVNFYDRNQWIDGGAVLAPGDPRYRPLRLLLAEVHRRYGRPLFIAETGAEGDDRVPWFRYVCDEVAAARDASVPIAGVCIYPVVDYPGWDDDRHVPVGLWGYPDRMGARPAHLPLLEEVRRQQLRFERAAAA